MVVRSWSPDPDHNSTEKKKKTPKDSQSEKGGMSRAVLVSRHMSSTGPPTLRDKCPTMCLHEVSEKGRVSQAVAVHRAVTP